MSSASQGFSIPLKAAAATASIDDTSLPSRAETAAAPTGPQPRGNADEDVTIHSAAQRGDVMTMERLVKDGKATANDRDDQNVTPLHWAAINAQLGACRFLLDHGADVDAIGGDLVATPLQWAARNGHLYVLQLLIAHGADPSLSDSQGFNTLHLVTHSSMVMPLLYILHQPVAVDAKDSDGHTALMWAAYQGDAISLDLLLHQSASPNTRDNSGLSPLHWAVVKGNAVCIRRLIEAGANLDIKDEQGKTAGDMAEELKSIGAWRKGLEDAGRKSDGNLKSRVLNERNTKIAIFCLPTVFGYLIIQTLTILPWYTSILFALGEFYMMHHIITRTLLDYKNTGDGLAKSPYFASIIVASMVWVGQAWLTRLVYHTPGFALFNLAFCISYGLSAYNFVRAVTLDPGTAPKPRNDAELKEIIEDLASTGRFNGTNFCIVCMAKKPLRSKHCRIDNKCTARFDHHCPWIWNCVGVNNHRQFLIFILTLFSGVVLFDILAFQYFAQSAPTWDPALGAPCILPSVLCTASTYDTHLFAIAFWATLQLSWTTILVVGQVWQVTRQMTTLEVSNLGRYGFMGGRGGSSLRDQSGAMAGVGGGGGTTGMDPTGVDEMEVERGEGVLPPPNPGHGQPGHVHGAGRGGGAGRGMRMGGKMGFLLQILGLDRFTKGKAAKGLAMAGKDQNPFDQGLIRNCGDFWTAGASLGVDYTQLYEIPAEGWERRPVRSAMKIPSMRGRGGGGGGYEPVRTSMEEDV